MAYITKTAIEVIEFVKSKGIEVRFSSEDSFRSDLVDLLSIYSTVDKIGVNRVGIADTVGCANPRQVYDLVRTLRGVVGCDIEIHLHNDTGMGGQHSSRVLHSCSRAPQLLLMHTPRWKREPRTLILVGYLYCFTTLYSRTFQPSSVSVNASALHLWEVSLPVFTLPTPNTSRPSTTCRCSVRLRTWWPRLSRSIYRS